jgi:hypothetical protein
MTLGLIKFNQVIKMELGMGMEFMFMTRNYTSQPVYHILVTSAMCTGKNTGYFLYLRGIKNKIKKKR